MGTPTLRRLRYDTYDGKTVQYWCEDKVSAVMLKREVLTSREKVQSNIVSDTPDALYDHSDPSGLEMDNVKFPGRRSDHTSFDQRVGFY